MLSYITSNIQTAYSTSARTTAEAPKPNKRFLRNILRETDSHNQALLAKEAEESRARLKALREKEAREARKLANGGRSPGDNCEDRHRAKRRRVDVIARDSNRLSPPTDFERDGSKRHRSKERIHRRRKEHDDSEDDYNRNTRRMHNHRTDKGNTLDQEITRSLRRAESHRRHRSGSRERSNSGEEDKHHKTTRADRHRRTRRQDRKRDRSASPERPKDRERSARERRHRESYKEPRSRSRSNEHSHRRQRSPSKEKLRHRNGAPNIEVRKFSTSGKRSNRWDVAPSPPTSTRASRTIQGQSTSESDPLEDIVGPLPPPPLPAVKVRGRGAISSSAMDSHFSASYDPNADIEPEVGPTDDWEMALEAMRDRAKFKQTQGDRLRAAGFTENEVKKWEKGSEKTEEDVRWAKKGEGREWDRGKVVDEASGHVELQPEWGRLKGT